MPEFLISTERIYLISEFVEKLPQIRKKVRISQEELGEKIGKSRQKISDIERLAAPMGWDTYLAACVALEYAGAFDEHSDGWFFESKKKWFK
jgi:transcriptional regulator with XRE-family HTH domain